MLSVIMFSYKWQPLGAEYNGRGKLGAGPHLLCVGGCVVRNSSLACRLTVFSTWALAAGGSRDQPQLDWKSGHKSDLVSNCGTNFSATRHLVSRITSPQTCGWLPPAPPAGETFG